MNNTPKKTTEEWRRKKGVAGKMFFASRIMSKKFSIDDYPQEIVVDKVTFVQKSRLSLERKRVAEEIVGMAEKSEEHTIRLEKHNDLNLKFAYFKQMGWNQSLSSLISKIREKYLLP